MSEQNVEVVRRAFEAYNRGDLDAAVADFAPEFEEFEDARVVVDDITDAGDQVLVSVSTRGRGRRSGVEATWSVWQLWTLRDGKIVDGLGFTSRDEAYKAAVLSE